MPFTNSARSSVLPEPVLVAQLPGHRQPVRLVLRHQVRRQPVRRLEVRQPDRHALVDHPVPQHVDDAALVQLGGQPVRELRLRPVRVTAVPLDQLVPQLDLRRAQEREQLRGVQAPDRVEVPDLALRLVVLDRVVATLRQQPRTDLRLELLLVRTTHHATPGISNSPVTAAVINACRCSRSSSTCRSAATATRRAVAAIAASLHDLLAARSSGGTGLGMRSSTSAVRDVDRSFCVDS